MSIVSPCDSIARGGNSIVTNTTFAELSASRITVVDGDGESGTKMPNIIVPCTVTPSIVACQFAVANMFDIWSAKYKASVSPFVYWIVTWLGLAAKASVSCATTAGGSARQPRVAFNSSFSVRAWEASLSSSAARSFALTASATAFFSSARTLAASATALSASARALAASATASSVSVRAAAIAIFASLVAFSNAVLASSRVADIRVLKSEGTSSVD